MKRDLSCLFDTASNGGKVLPRGQIMASMQTYQADFRTCLMEIRPARDARISLMALLVRGQMVNLYTVGSDSVARLEHLDLMAALPDRRSSFVLRALALTPNTARLVKILLEQAGVETSAPCQTVHLSKVVGQAAQNSWPLLLHLSWPKAQGCALLPGHGLPVRHMLFITSNQVLHSDGGLDALYQWQETSCRVQLYRGSEIIPAWQEYFLHYSFNWLVDYLFARLELLTGRSLLNAIIRDLNFTCLANGWNIGVSASTVTDQAVFSSPRQAEQVYQRLMRILLHHASSMIDDRTLDMLLRDVRSRLHLPYRLYYDRFRVDALSV